MTEQDNILLDIPPLSQRDPRWIDVQLGSSNTTIGGVWVPANLYLDDAGLHKSSRSMPPEEE